MAGALARLAMAGYAERARIKADHLVALPTGMTTRQAMILGTPGLTAMFALQGLEAHGLAPDAGNAEGREVLVTGAGWRWGWSLLLLLSALGYRVAAVTGRIEQSGDFLREMGADNLVARAELAEAQTLKPLESERWAACIDNVGGCWPVFWARYVMAGR